MKRKRPPRCPECDKLHAVKEKSQAIGEFLEWSQREGMIFAVYLETRNEDDQLVPARISIEKLLAQYFDIDLGKVEAERRQLLKSLRAGK